MDGPNIRIDVTLRLEAAISQAQTQQILRNLGLVDGVTVLRLADDTQHPLLYISFDPYRLSARDILKWLAQHTIRAELLFPLSKKPSANPHPRLQPLR